MKALMKVLVPIKCLSGATPKTKTLTLVVIDGTVYVELKSAKDVLKLGDDCGHDVAVQKDGTLLVIDDYYD